MLEQLTLIWTLLSNMLKSYCMKDPCQNLTSSRVTKRLMGTKLVKISTQVPALGTRLSKRDPLLVYIK